MLLPIRAAFGARAALAGLIATLPTRTAEFRTVSPIVARTRKPRPLVAATAIPRVAPAIPVTWPVITRLVEFRPVEFAFAIATRRTLGAFLALLPGFGFPARRTIAEILLEIL